MLAALLLIAQVPQKAGDVDVAPYLHAHREADRALTAGKNAEARAGFEKCLELAPKNATVAYGLACARAKAGEKDAALEWLARAVEWGYADAELALWDGDLASLRDSDRFKAAVEAMRGLVKAPSSLYCPRVFDERAKSNVSDVGIDRAAARVAAGHSGGELVLLDAHSGEELARSHCPGGKVWDLALRPDGKRVVALSFDGKAHFWNPEEAQVQSRADAMREPEPDDGWPFGALVAFDPTGERVLIAGRNHGASLWTAEGARIRALEHTYGGFFGVALAWSSDGSRIASWHDGEIDFLDGKTGGELDARITTTATSKIHCVEFDPSGKWIASGHSDGRVRLWDAKTLALVRESERFVDPVFDSDDYFIHRVSFAPVGDRLAFTTGRGVYARVLDAPACKVLVTSDFLEGRMGEPSQICWAPDGRRLWAAFISGGLWIAQVDVDDSPAALEVKQGRPPEVSAGGLAVFTSYNEVSSFDTKTGRVLWMRVNLGRSGTLFRTPGGWFDASFDDLAELTVYPPTDRDEGTSLASLAEQLFDPKRVRAAKAGVALAPIKW